MTKHTDWNMTNKPRYLCIEKYQYTIKIVIIQ